MRNLVEKKDERAHLLVYLTCFPLSTDDPQTGIINGDYLLRLYIEIALKTEYPVIDRSSNCRRDTKMYHKVIRQTSLVN